MVIIKLRLFIDMKKGLLCMLLLMFLAIGHIKAQGHYYYVRVDDNCRNTKFYSETVCGEFVTDSLIDRTKFAWKAQFPFSCYKGSVNFTVCVFNSKEEVDMQKAKDMAEALEHNMHPKTFFLEFYND